MHARCPVLAVMVYYYTKIFITMQSTYEKSSKNYPQAKKYGRNALILTVLNVVFTLSVSLLITGLSLGSWLSPNF